MNFIQDDLIIKKRTSQNFNYFNKEKKLKLLSKINNKINIKFVLNHKK